MGLRDRRRRGLRRLAWIPVILAFPGCFTISYGRWGDGVVVDHRRISPAVMLSWDEVDFWVDDEGRLVMVAPDGSRVIEPSPGLGAYIGPIDPDLGMAVPEAYRLEFDEPGNPIFVFPDGTRTRQFQGGQYDAGYTYPFRKRDECSVNTIWSEVFPDPDPYTRFRSQTAETDIELRCSRLDLVIPVRGRKLKPPIVGFDGSLSFVLSEDISHLWANPTDRPLERWYWVQIR